MTKQNLVGYDWIRPKAEAVLGQWHLPRYWDDVLNLETAGCGLTFADPAALDHRPSAELPPRIAARLVKATT